MLRACAYDALVNMTFKSDVGSCLCGGAESIGIDGPHPLRWAVVVTGLIMPHHPFRSPRIAYQCQASSDLMCAMTASVFKLNPSNIT